MLSTCSSPSINDACEPRMGETSEEDEPSASSQTRRCRLARMVTQPRGLYEALDADRSRTSSRELDDQEDQTADDLEGLCQVLRTSHLLNSDSRSPEDNVETVTWDESAEKNETSSGSGVVAQNHPGTAESSPYGADENRTLGTAVEFEGRRPGSRRSRNRRLDSISNLEMCINQLETQVSTLSPQVDFLNRRRWILLEENNALKQKIAIAQLSREIFEADQIEVLKREVQLLRCQQQQQLQYYLQKPRSPDGALDVVKLREDGRANFGDVFQDQADGSGNLLDEGSNFRTSSGQQGQTVGNLLDDQGSNFRTSSGLQGQTVGNLCQEGAPPPRKSDDTSKEERHTGSQSSSPEEVKTSTKLVKWPSTLYRSVSAIRRDVLDEIPKNS